jgi:hypothetical protein
MFCYLIRFKSFEVNAKFCRKLISLCTQEMQSNVHQNETYFNNKKRKFIEMRCYFKFRQMLYCFKLQMVAFFSWIFGFICQIDFIQFIVSAVTWSILICQMDPCF